MKRGRDEAGYTLVEVLVAGTLTLCLALPVLGLLRKAGVVVDTLQTRFALGAQARQVFALLGDGTAQFAANDCASGTPAACSARGFSLIEGLRSRQAAPAGGSLRTTAPAGQFTFADGTLSVSGDAVGSATAPLTIACTGAQNPVPDCTGTELRQVAGWIGAAPVIAVTGRTAAVDLAIASPFRALRARSCPRAVADPTLAANPASIVEGCAAEQFRTIFTLNVEANP